MPPISCIPIQCGETYQCGRETGALHIISGLKSDPPTAPCEMPFPNRVFHMSFHREICYLLLLPLLSHLESYMIVY